MRIIIAGSRTFNDYDLLKKTLDIFAIEYGKVESSMSPGFYYSTTKILAECILSGKARGADTLGEQWAKANSVPIKEYPAEWDKHGKSAGYIRNKEMAENADALVAFWDGKSKGTKHMIDLALEKGLTVVVIPFKE